MQSSITRYFWCVIVKKLQDFGKAISKSNAPPNSKFAKAHKNRLWLANIKSGDYGGCSTVAAPYDFAPFIISLDESPSAVYFSEYLESEKFLPTSVFTINVDDGEPITAFERFENKYLIAF